MTETERANLKAMAANLDAMVAMLENLIKLEDLTKLKDLAKLNDGMTVILTGMTAVQPPVAPPSVEPPAATAFAEDAPLPPSTGNLTATNAATLTSQINAAAPGNHVTITGSPNLGAMTISKDFPAAKPLVIKAQTQLGPRFSKLVLDGTGIIVSGCVVDSGDIDNECSLYMNGTDIRFTRGKCLQARSVVRKSGGTRALVDHCELATFRWRGIYTATTNARLTVARCYIHDGRSLGTATTDVQLLSVIAFGTSFPNRTDDIGGIARFNYIAGIAHSSAGADVAHNKAKNSIYAFNKYVGGEAFYNRNGVGTIWVGNDIPSTDLVLTDFDQLALGNNCKNIYIRGGNSNKFARTEAGSSGSWDGGGGAATQYAAMSACVGGNRVSGKIIVGKASGPEQSKWCRQRPTPADGTIIRGQPGTIALQGPDGCKPAEGAWHINDDIQAGVTIPKSWWDGKWWALGGKPPSYTSAPQELADVGPNRAGKAGL